jgi:hypothetical protein
VPSLHSRRKRLGCILALVGLIAVVVAACSKHDSPTGPSTASVQGQKPLSIPIGRPPGPPFKFPPPPVVHPPFQPPGPPPWAFPFHDAELQGPADTAVAQASGSGMDRSVSLYGVLMVGVAGVFVQRLGGRRRRK